MFVEGIGSVSVMNSLFYHCLIEGERLQTGGAISLLSIQVQPFIECSSFICCTSNCEGDGISIYKSFQSQTLCAMSCLFLCCKSLSSDYSDGGSFEVWSSPAAVGCSNSLFADSYSAMRVGASYLGVYNDNHDSSIPIFLFCFFADNSAKQACGNDVFFGSWMPEKPFLQCLSTTHSNRIYPSGHDNTWLPLTNNCVDSPSDKTDYHLEHAFFRFDRLNQISIHFFQFFFHGMYEATVHNTFFSLFFKSGFHRLLCFSERIIGNIELHFMRFPLYGCIRRCYLFS